MDAPIESPRTGRKEGTSRMTNASAPAVPWLDENKYIDGKMIVGAVGLGSSQESAYEVVYP